MDAVGHGDGHDDGGWHGGDGLDKHRRVGLGGHRRDGLGFHRCIDEHALGSVVPDRDGLNEDGRDNNLDVDGDTLDGFGHDDGLDRNGQGNKGLDGHRRICLG